MSSQNLHIQRLRDELAKAEAAGDEKRAERLRKALNEAGTARPAPPVDATR